jgi:hypothetical protein
LVFGFWLSAFGFWLSAFLLIKILIVATICHHRAAAKIYAGLET